jgi:hypothetical protein
MDLRYIGKDSWTGVQWRRGKRDRGDKTRGVEWKEERGRGLVYEGLGGYCVVVVIANL